METTEGNLHGFDIWKQSYIKSCAAIDQDLKKHTEIDSFRSGTTALTVIKQVIHNMCYIWHLQVLIFDLISCILKWFGGVLILSNSTYFNAYREHKEFFLGRWYGEI